MGFSLEDNLYGKFKTIYNNSPQEFKDLIGKFYRSIPKYIIYGKTYSEYLKFLEKAQWWDKDEILNYQWKSIEKLIKHSIINVPYYKDLFEKNSISIKNINDFDDFKKIPFLTKSKVRKNFNGLIATNIPRGKRLKVATGGTTGMPLPIIYEKGYTRPFERAFTVHGLKRIGYSVGDKIAVIRGDVVPHGNDNAPSFYDPIRNRLILSSYHMIEDKLWFYIKKINDFKPKFLHVYPSCLVILAKYMKKNKLRAIPSIQGIIVSSETIYDWQINLFKDIFNCNVYPWYGLNEMVALAGFCEHNAYHMFPEYSYVEFIPDNQEIENQCNAKQIVGTGFGNHLMPFIRYKTMDYVVLGKDECKCGRKSKVIEKVVGRKQDFFVDKTGSLITFIYADVPIWSVMDKIIAYQYEQKEPGRVELKIETNNNEKLEIKKHVEKEFRKIYNRFDIEITFVESIKKTKSGKFLYLKQYLING